MSPRILLFGTTGQVGHELLRALALQGDVTGLDRSGADFTKPASLRDVIARLRPAIVVNAVAHTAVDRAENEEALARTINAEAPGVIAQAAAAVGAAMLHYSTDYVFDGTKTGWYSETDSTAPLNAYGRTKRDGELAVAAANPRHIVLRTSWVVSARGSNFVRTMLRLARERDALRVVADQRGAPATARLIADITASVVNQVVSTAASEERWGTYHLVAAGETTWHGLATHVIRIARELGAPLKAGPDDVAAISTAEHPTLAPRPMNSRLDTTKLRAVFGVNLPDWTLGVDEVVGAIVRSGELP